MKRSCRICGTHLAGGQRRYCGSSCARRGHNANRRSKRPRPQKCLACPTLFRPARAGQRYCNNVCRQSDYRERFLKRMARLEALDPMHFLRADMRSLTGRDMVGETMKPQERRELDQGQAAIEKARADEEIARAGIDPRPARKDGRAVK